MWLSWILCFGVSYRLQLRWPGLRFNVEAQLGKVPLCGCGRIQFLHDCWTLVPRWLLARGCPEAFVIQRNPAFVTLIPCGSSSHRKSRGSIVHRAGPRPQVNKDSYLAGHSKGWSRWGEK